MSINYEDQTTLFNFVVKQGNGVKGLIDSGMSYVPQPFPINLSQLDGPRHKEVAKQITETAETLGFFQVVNHGVSVELLELLKTSAHTFFAQPPEKKAVYLKEVNPSRLVKYGTSFDYVSMLYTNDQEVLQHWPPQCREVALDFLKSSMAMVKIVVEVLMGDLGVRLEEDRMNRLMGTKMVNMNYYPTCPSFELTIGVGRHSDMGMLTVLLQDGIGGLYVKLDNSDWGFSHQRWRYFSEKIGLLPEVVRRDGVARYKELLFQDYMNNFFGQPHDGKKTLDFARAD
ncbi:hypothetical protein N665_0095s0017 [Sinapis alba]|nr:hypothetical protein N665_0095s0017 [Sinapis alba]